MLIIKLIRQTHSVTYTSMFVNGMYTYKLTVLLYYTFPKLLTTFCYRLTQIVRFPISLIFRIHQYLFICTDTLVAESIMLSLLSICFTVEFHALFLLLITILIIFPALWSFWFYSQFLKLILKFHVLLL
jgi:hypothetical protein